MLALPEHETRPRCCPSAHDSVSNQEALRLRGEPGQLLRQQGSAWRRGRPLRRQSGEFLHQGSWAPSVMRLGPDDAHVVVRTAGCGQAVDASPLARFGAGSGPICLDELNCTGKEPHVWRCPSGAGAARLQAQEGRGGRLLRVSGPEDEARGGVSAAGCGHAWKPWEVQRLALGNGRIWLDEVQVQGQRALPVGLCCGALGAERLQDTRRTQGEVLWDQATLQSSLAYSPCLDPCSHPGALLFLVLVILVTSCQMESGAQRTLDNLVRGREHPKLSLIQCFPLFASAGSRPKSCPTAAPCTDKEKLRLRGGGTQCSGRVEVWHSGSWGTVCDDSWSLAEAEVVCQQLGCGHALEALGSAAFGPGNGSIWLDEVQCRGSEPSLWACAAEPWGQNDCKHEEDAGVRCSGEWRSMGSAPVEQGQRRGNELGWGRMRTLRKDNFAPRYSRYAATVPGQGEHSDSWDLFCGLCRNQPAQERTDPEEPLA
ncbi:Antigen WC1.1, partial [Camelus dromedarius]